MPSSNNIGMPNPLAVIRSQIEDKSVRKAFDKVTLDAKTPWEIDSKEAGVLFDAASRDNPWVDGDSTTPRELRDLNMIREKGGWLLKSPAARKAYDVQLDATKKLPQLEWKDDDGSIRSYQPAVNKVSIRGKASGYVWTPPGACPIGAPSTVKVNVDDKTFALHPKTGESANSIIKRLAAQMTDAGYKVKTSNFKGAAFLTIQTSPSSGVKQFKEGAWTDLKGTIKKYTPENPPRDGGAGAFGSWLKLDTPVKIGDLEVKELYLEYRNVPEGQAVQLNGRLDVREGPAEIFPPIRFGVLSGMTNLTAGQPRYDGKDFFGATGKKLPQLHWNEPLVMDKPATLFVPDQGADKMFVGAIGGMIAPWMNHFHGFRGAVNITGPSRTDIKTVRWDHSAGGPVLSASGKALKMIGKETSPIVHSQAHWFLDPASKTAYRFAPIGGFGALQPKLDQVVRLGDINL